MKLFILISVYISSLIGAGFASGLEIKTYFVDFGIKGLIMIFISGILFFITSYKMFIMSLENTQGGFTAFCGDVFLFLSPAVKIISLLFMISTFSAMLSCGAELLGNNITGSLALSVLCLVLMKDGSKGLGNVSTMLFPIMLLGIISVCIGSLKPEVNVLSRLARFCPADKKGFLISPFVYVSYNTITALPIIFSSRVFIHSRKNAFLSALFSSMIITVIMLLCAVCIMLRFNEIKTGIPLYDISPSKAVYKIILISAVITTAVSNLLAISDMLGEMLSVDALRLRKYICLTGFFLSLIGFSNLVNIVYTFFGCIGIFELIVIVLKR